jgi:hypothetical protein
VEFYGIPPEFASVIGDLIHAAREEGAFMGGAAAKTIFRDNPQLLEWPEWPAQ